MALKAKLTKDEHGKLESALQALYVEKDGAYVLQVEGLVSQAEYDQIETKLAEFRDNNRKLHGDLQKLKDVDPEEYRRLKAEADKLAKAGIQPGADLAQTVAAAVEKATNPLNDRIKAIETERDAARQALNDKALDDRLWEIGTKHGIRESAKRDFLARAREVFVLGTDGAPQARNGDAPVYSKRRGQTTLPLTPEEWVQDPEWLIKEADHLYKDSKGGGATKNPTTTPGGTRIVANDLDAVGRNLEDIASGKAVVAGTAAH